MLHAIAREDFQAAVVELDGNMDDDFARGSPQNLAHAVVETQALRGIVQPRLGGKQRIKFIDYGGLLGFEDHAVPPETIMDRRPERRGL